MNNLQHDLKFGLRLLGVFCHSCRIIFDRKVKICLFKCMFEVSNVAEFDSEVTFAVGFESLKLSFYVGSQLLLRVGYM